MLARPSFRTQLWMYLQVAASATRSVSSSFLVCLFAAGLGDISVAVRLKPNFNRAVQSAKIIREDCAFVESYVIR